MSHKKQFNSNKKRADIGVPNFLKSGQVGGDSDDEQREMRRLKKIAQAASRGNTRNGNARLIREEELAEEQRMMATEVLSKPVPATPEFPTELYNQLGELSSRGRGADPVLTSIRVADKNLVTVFAREDDEIVNARRLLARNALTSAPLTATQLYKTVIPVPRRPDWRGMSRDALHNAEEVSFARWLQSIYANYPTARLNKFEHNLNVWRQLWRVCEKSDVVVMVADARHPLLHFSPGLYQEVIGHLRKPLVLVLNKIDLVPPEVLASWKIFFKRNFPEVELAFFSSYPSTYLRSVYGELVNMDVKENGEVTFKNDSRDNEDFSDEEEASANAILKNYAEAHIVEPLKLGESVDLSNKKSQVVSSLSEHAAQVLKLKKSPVIVPVGAEGVLDCCKKVFIRFLKQRGVAAEVADKLDFESTRLLKAFDRQRLLQVKKEKEQEAMELRQKLLNAKIHADKKRAAGEAVSDDEEEEEKAGVSFDHSGEHDEGSDSESKSEHSSDDEGDSDSDIEAAKLILMGNKAKKNKKKMQKMQRQKALIAVGSIKAWDDEEEETAKYAPKNIRGGKKTGPVAAGGRAKPASALVDEDEDNEDAGLDNNADLGYLESDNEAESEDDDESKPAAVSTDVTRYFVNKTKFVLGMVGHPNAGKSSLINALTGKKVVSVSRQPGHTKHLQTIQINEITTLCDCPGLVFPAVDMSPAIQVVSGITPVPQARELHSAVQHVGERVKLQKLLGLKWAHTEHGLKQKGFNDAKELIDKHGDQNNVDCTEDDINKPWSAEDICHAYAVKRGFLNAKGRVNFNQAAQAIIYMVVDGKIPFFATPPAFTEGPSHM